MDEADRLQTIGEARERRSRVMDDAHGMMRRPRVVSCARCYTSNRPLSSSIYSVIVRDMTHYDGRDMDRRSVLCIALKTRTFWTPIYGVLPIRVLVYLAIIATKSTYRYNNAGPLQMKAAQTRRRGGVPFGHYHATHPARNTGGTACRIPITIFLLHFFIYPRGRWL